MTELKKYKTNRSTPSFLTNEDGSARPPRVEETIVWASEEQFDLILETLYGVHIWPAAIIMPGEAPPTESEQPRPDELEKWTTIRCIKSTVTNEDGTHPPDRWETTIIWAENEHQADLTAKNFSGLQLWPAKIIMPKS